MRGFFPIATKKFSSSLTALTLLLLLIPTAVFAQADGVITDRQAALQAVMNAIEALPNPANIVGKNPANHQAAFNAPALLAAIGSERHNVGAGGQPTAAVWTQAGGIYALIGKAKELGAVDGDFNLEKFNAVVTKINEISNTPDGKLDIYVVNITGSSTHPAAVNDLGVTTTFPNVLLINGDGSMAVSGIITKNRPPSGNQTNWPALLSNIGMGIAPDGRYMATVNAGGVVINLERNYEARRVFSVRTADGNLKLGIFNNADTFDFAAGAKIYVYRTGSSGLEIIAIETSAQFTTRVASYPGGYDWNDEINIFTDKDGRIVELFVNRIDTPYNDYGLYEYNGKFELFKSTPLTNAQLTAAGIPADNVNLGAANANGDYIRTIDAGIYDPVKNGADKGKKYPMFIWLHGVTNGRNEQWRFIYTEPANFAKPDYQKDFNNGAAYIVAPRANEHTPTGNPHWMTTATSTVTGYNMSVYTPAMIRLIRDIIEAYPNVDTDRIYVGGFSAGGYMTWSTLYEVQTGDHGFKFAAAVPVCDASHITAEQRARLSGVPIWMIIGKYDGLFNANYRASVDQVRAFNRTADPADPKANARVTILNTIIDPFGTTIAQHSSWTAVTLNMIYAHPANENGKTPSNFLPGTKPGAPTPAPVFDGPAMQYYGTIFEESNPLFELGADPQSSFSNKGTFTGWLGQWSLGKP